MKNNQVIMGLLFKPGNECTKASLAAQAILTANASSREKIRSILGLPGGAADDEGINYLPSPDLFSGSSCSLGDVKAIIAATLVTCSNEAHGLANLITERAKNNPRYSLCFRDGCVLGLLSGLLLTRLTSSEKCDFEPDLEEVTGDSAILLCILGLIWTPCEGDAMPPGSAGELTNLIAEYVQNKGSNGYKSPARMNAIKIFLGQAGIRYRMINCFPSQLAEAVVTTFLHQTFGIVPMAELLELVGKAITAPFKG